MSNAAQVTFEIVPHPRFRGEWLPEPDRGAPFGLWYRDQEHAGATPNGSDGSCMVRKSD